MHDELMETLREECSRALWSRGVGLARGVAPIRIPSSDPDAIVVRIPIPGRAVAPTVHLFPDDEDWVCDCSRREEPCEHVVVAMLALQRGELDTSAPDAPEAWTIGYRFTTQGDSLAFDRVLVGRGEESPLRTTASAAALQREGAAVLVTGEDLHVEHALGSRTRGILTRAQVPALLKALSHVVDLRVDGALMRASARGVGAVARVEDVPRGWQITLVQDPEIDRVYANGIAILGDEIAPVKELGMDRSEVAELRRGRIYTPEDAAELTSTVLPSLRHRVALDVVSTRLPQPVSAEARIVVQVDSKPEGLGALALLVYGDPPIARVDGGTLVALAEQVPFRNRTREAILTRKLKEDLGLGVGREAIFSDEDAIEFSSRLQRWRAGQIQGDAHRRYRIVAPVFPVMEGQGGDLTVAFRTPGDSAEEARHAAPGDVLSAWRSGSSLVALNDGTFGPLPIDWLALHGEVLMDYLEARRAAGLEQTPTHALGLLATLCDSLEHPRPPDLTRLEALFSEDTTEDVPSPPPELEGVLRPYQESGVGWLIARREAGLGAMLADDMGLGKTLQALASARGRTLVVAPASVIHAWADESRRFRPQLRVSTYHGRHRELAPEADLTITTWALLRADIDALKAPHWDAVILDEAQAIKNPDSQVAAAAFQLRSHWRLTLSGTPIENRLEELWSQAHFVNPGLLGGRTDFQERTARPIARGDEQAAQRLRARIRPFLLRRRKEEVAPDLPPRIPVTRHCTLSTEERTLYSALAEAARTDILQRVDAGASTMEALEALLRLRQAACHPALVPGQEGQTSSKIQELLRGLETATAGDHKALVFSQWTGFLDLIEPHLDAAGITWIRLDGATRDRGAIVREFQAASGPSVLLISLKAGGTGLTLTAADHVFLMDPWWNPAVEDQAADRAHRIGQERPVIIHRMVARDTVEERILALQESKRALADQVLSGAAGAGGISRDEILELLA